MSDDLSTKARETAAKLRTEAHKTRCFVGLDRVPYPFPQFIRKSGENMDHAADLLDQLIEAKEKAEAAVKEYRTYAERLCAAFGEPSFPDAVERAEKAEARAKELEADQREWNESQRLFEVEVIPRLESERDAANEKVAVVEALLDEIEAWTKNGIGAASYADTVLHAKHHVATILSKRENQTREGGTECAMKTKEEYEAERKEPVLLVVDHLGIRIPITEGFLIRTLKRVPGYIDHIISEVKDEDSGT